MKWRYALPPCPPEVALLPVGYDIHIGGAWVLVDATNDPPLANGGLTVAGWDGVSATAPHYAPTGPVWREGEDDREIAAALADITVRYETAFAGADQYVPAFNAYLGLLRREDQGNEPGVFL